MSASLACVLLPNEEVCREISNQVERGIDQGDSKSCGNLCKSKNDTMPFSLFHSSPISRVLV